MQSTKKSDKLCIHMRSEMVGWVKQTHNLHPGDCCLCVVKTKVNGELS